MVITVSHSVPPWTAPRLAWTLCRQTHSLVLNTLSRHLHPNGLSPNKWVKKKNNGVRVLWTNPLDCICQEGLFYQHMGCVSERGG